MAFAHPGVDVVAAQRAAHMRAEELVGAEQHLGVRRNRANHLKSIRRRAADVGLGLHGSGGVDVADHHRARVLGLPFAQLIGGDAIGQRAAGFRVRDENPLVRGEDLGGLGHEVHTGEDDRGRIALGSDPRQRQGITHMIGDVLDRGVLVVVRQDDRVLLACCPAYPVGPLLEVVVDGRC